MVRTEQSTKISNLMCIWYHDRGTSSDLIRHMKQYLDKHFNYVCIFSTLQQLTAYLASELVIEHFIIIISHDDAKEAAAIEGLVNRRKQFQRSYQINLEHHATSPLPGIASMCAVIETNFNNIINDIKNRRLVEHHEETRVDEMENIRNDLVPLFHTFKTISAQCSLCDLSLDSVKFFLFQSLTEILIRKEYQTQDWNHMWHLCVKDYIEDPKQTATIKKLQADYKRENPIYCYTQDTGFFRLLNRAFRLEDIERIFRFGCYIADVHRQLDELSQNQRLNGNQNNKTFFRGKKYSADVIQQLKDSIGHFISMNGLLSTYKEYVMASVRSGLDEKNTDYHSVIFEFNVHENMLNLIRPFANISHLSAVEAENEVLFCMGFVWKLESMVKIPSDGWYITLHASTNYNSQMSDYIEELREDWSFFNIGKILYELGDHTNANNFYQRMLDEPNLPEETRCHLYYNMGKLSADEGKYVEARRHFLEADKLVKTTIRDHRQEAPLTSRDLFAHNVAPTGVAILNNLGQMYLKDGRCTEAAQNFEDALLEPSSNVERATVLNNYALLEYLRGNIEQACVYLDEAVRLAENDASYSEFKRNLDNIKRHLPVTPAEMNN